MTERERLIELIQNAVDGCARHWAEVIADHLLANGVIVPPCKVGQTVWCIYNYTKPKEFQIAILSMSENHYSFTIETKDGVYKHYCDKEAVGKYVFFTREEAEKALKERSKDESNKTKNGCR